MKLIYIINIILGIITGYSLGIAYLSYNHDNLTARTEHLFVYDTLTNPMIRTLMCSCAVSGKPATLKHYQKVNRSIKPNNAQTVEGQLLLLSPDELARLDRYERVPDRYRRVRVHVGKVFSWVYIKN